jgi:archaemetzincin
MKKIIITTVFLVLTLVVTVFLFSFENRQLINRNIVKNEKIIHIVPLGDIDEKYINFVKERIISFYGFNCVIEKRITLTDDILASSKKRYEASKILAKYNSNKNLLLLTSVDIAHFNRKKNIAEYGIIGLGYRPGKTCVVSTFRIKRNVSEKKMMERLEKVSIHEVGHNLGLDHCTNDKKCLMNDVNGTVTQIDFEKVWLCDKCSKQIGMKNKTLK